MMLNCFSGYIMYAFVELGEGEHYAPLNFETASRAMHHTRVLVTEMVTNEQNYSQVIRYVT